jgi:anthranilate synthase component 1
VATKTTAERIEGGCVLRTTDSYQDLFALAAQFPQRYPYLLESVAHGTPQARFDILFACPGDSLTLDGAGQLHASGVQISGESFLAGFDSWWSREQHGCAVPDVTVPFRGGWFVYLGYELAAEIEPTLDLPTTADTLPTAFAVRCPAAIIRDHEQRCIHIVAEQGNKALVDILHRDLEAASSSGDGAPAGPDQVPVALQEEDPQRYLDGVDRIKRYIVDGDVFQVNLSRLWNGELPEETDPAQLYARLRRQNPAPFAGLVRWGRHAIISSSPERLVSVRGEAIETRPIAGTRPRGNAESADRAYSDELLGHPKERAEHIMLIDLERNDLGRVCQSGSVEVSELMVLESYAHVHHIVSNVRGRLRPGVTPSEVIRATFPGGTITGCPKVRCMEIIAELEGTGRGAYTGSMGYVNCDGCMDLNILIRTLVQENNKITLRAGAGIVADSIAAHELAETRAKARGLLLALGLSE